MKIPAAALWATVPWIPAAVFSFATVVGLLLGGGPTAVFRFVVPIVVNSIDGVSVGWSSSHVSDERLKRFQPTIAYLDSTTTVIHVVPRARNAASALHQRPDVVFRRFCHPMSSASIRRALSLQTSTRMDLLAKMILTHGGCVSAITLANPHSVPRVERPAPTRPAGDSLITPRQQRFLDAAATLSTLGTECTRETVAGWLGIHPRGGSVGEELSALAEAGLITLDRGRIAVTDSGMAAAGEVDPQEAIERAKSGLSERQRRFFDLITAAYPGETTREAIAEACSLHPRGGSLGEDLGRLVGRGLVEGRRGLYRARDFLFAGV